ncbi:hypothetical protein I2I05_15500 [Hymenobacter sp. BT683]|uniref:DUF2442 domain-containing protein n=1 Tax=Hymenobacter jeongseonensis TaxID=2791027 RepID=A0ABS0IKB0_9BACT|nr:hypothetical protein [Hymenobacter jeongseonensis]MBF9238807.1 hypothetical protein [Hymenobacter jeongseonensis]
MNSSLPDTTDESSKKPLIRITFFNRQATKLTLWIELACIEVELEACMEYRVESDETEYTIHFDGQFVVLYLENRFGPKVFKRPYPTDFINPGDWELIEDYSDIE